MPILIDPDTALPENTKRKMTASQIVLLLLYPVIFAVGLTVGLVIGLQQGRVQGTQQAQQTRTNTSVVPSSNTNVKTNTTNANTNVSNAFLNTNLGLSGGDYLKLDATTQNTLNQKKQNDLDRLVDQTLDLTDIIRQKDILELKYDILAYQVVEGSFPNSNNQLYKLDRSASDPLYAAMTTFNGGTYYERIDPESPQYYYGYTSDGTHFTLTCYLVGKKTIFQVQET